MLRVDHARWGQTPEELRQLATSAGHQRTRERFLALYEITQALCATQVAGRTGRHPQTVMEWLHLYNERGPAALAYRRTGGRPPLCPEIGASLGDAVRAAQSQAAKPPVAGADPPPRWTLRRLVSFVRDRFGRLCCRETIRAALRRLNLSWQKARKLLGRADPDRRAAFLEQMRPVLEGAQRDRHGLAYLDEAHIHQDADLGHGWRARGQRLHVASTSPGLAARVSLYGLYLYNEGQVRLWPYARANGEHTIDVLHRLRADFPSDTLTLVWDGAPYHRAKTVRAEAARCFVGQLFVGWRGRGTFDRRSSRPPGKARVRLPPARVVGSNRTFYTSWFAASVRHYQLRYRPKALPPLTRQQRAHRLHLLE